jgi:hypothetical protein
MFSDSYAHDPLLKHNAKISRERRGRDRMVVGFTTNVTFNNISVIVVAVSFIGGGNWSTRKKKHRHVVSH